MLAAASRRPPVLGIPSFVEVPPAPLLEKINRGGSLDSSEYPRGGRPLTAGLHGKTRMRNRSPARWLHPRITPPASLSTSRRWRHDIERDPWKT
jgi:hypothetical protein